MKKVFGILTAVLLLSSSINATTLFNLSSVDCFNYADRYATRIGFTQGLSHAEEHQVFLALYDECESSQNQEITMK